MKRKNIQKRHTESRILVNFRFKPETVRKLRYASEHLTRKTGKRVTMTDVLVMALSKYKPN